MSPTEALFHTVSTMWMINGNRKFPKPGQMVEAMGKEIREALSRLTSDETVAMPPGLLGPLGDEKAWRDQEAERERQKLFSEEMERRRAAMKLQLMWTRRMKRETPLS